MVVVTGIVAVIKKVPLSGGTNPRLLPPKLSGAQDSVNE
jgi:hypothetical protein